MSAYMNLIFKKNDDTNFTLKVNNTLTDMTATEISQHMDKIIEINPFNVDNALSEKVSAELKVTKTTEFDLV